MTEAYLEIVCFITQAFPEPIAERILFHLRPRLPCDLDRQITLAALDARVRARLARSAMTEGMMGLAYHN